MSIGGFAIEEATIPADVNPPIGRFARIWHVAGAFGRRDPSLFVAVFALWAVLSGLSLVTSQDAFSRTPVYSVARELGLNDNFVGTAMLIDGAFLLWGLGNTPPRVRASIALVTGVVWLFWSVIIFAGGLKVGLYSSSALWTGATALALMRSTAVHVVPQDKSGGGGASRSRD